MKLTKKQIVNRRRWANALMTSKQGRQALLLKDGTECCLGVACRVLVPNIKKKQLLNISFPFSRPLNLDLRPLIGATNEEIYYLVALNDGEPGTVWDNGLTHPEIGLYLYLTAEAGETYD
jgi:hypothetical protein